MEVNEINKIIDEYMNNNNDSPFVKDIDYTKSLDTLVPVWHKLDNDNNFGGICIYSCIIGERETFTVSSNLELDYGGFEADSHPYDEGSETIQEAASLATAKAIQELNDR